MWYVGWRCAPRCGGLLAMLASLLCTGVSTAAPPLQLRSAVIELTPQSPTAVVAALQSAADTRDADDGRRLLQFNAALDAPTRATLAAHGVTLLHYLGGHAYIAHVSASAAALTVETLPVLETLVAISPIAPAWKAAPNCTPDDVPEWAIVDDGPRGTRTVAMYILFQRDVDVLTTGLALLEGQDVVVRDVLTTINGAVIELRESQLAALTRLPEVLWVEPPLPRLRPVNADNRVWTQAGAVQVAPYNLSGAGVTVMVYDSKSARATHVDFQGRLTVLDGTPTADHATHVSGTIGGAGIADPLYKGMAPGVTLLSYGLEYDETDVVLYSNPGDLEADYLDAVTNHGAQIANNSISSNVEENRLDCAIQGDYGVTSELIDTLVRDTAGAPFRVVFAGGNERGSDFCDSEGFGDYYSVAPPAGAKNHITVGAIVPYTDEMSSFSSWGPTDDGRMKPDVCAPGVNVISCSAVSDTAYVEMQGTSMAAPTVTGCLALLMQDYRTHYPAADDPCNALLKVFLAQTAVDCGNAGPDYQFGYGSVRIQAAIDLMRTGQFYEADCETNQTYTLTTTVAAGQPELKVTLAWDDYPAEPLCLTALVNDLDLQLVAPDGTVFHPWTLDPEAPWNPAVQNAPNHRDNIEQVFVANPAAGEWRIEIVGTDVPQGPQHFALAAAAPFVAPASIQLYLPDGPPACLAPGVTTPVTIGVVPVNDALVPDSVLLHYRYVNGGVWWTQPLVASADGHYVAELPAGTCQAQPEWYVTAVGVAAGMVSLPADAPADVFTAEIATLTSVFDDDFETDKGWTVGGPEDTAPRGIWERADPEGTIAQPEDDHTPAGTLCYVTGPLAGTAAGSWDVDSGQTTLKSPSFDLAGLHGCRVSYWRWYSNSAGAGPDEDIFDIDLSPNDGDSWLDAEDVGPTGIETRGTWRYHEFEVDALVAPSDEMRIRFIASDFGLSSLVEAAVDDVHIWGYRCVASLADCNGNGIVDADDIATGRSADGDGNGVPDECEGPPPCPGDCNCDGGVDFFDIDPFVAALSSESSWYAYLQQAGYAVTCSYLGNNDLNNDGLVTFFDIDPFVERLVAGVICPQPPAP